MRTIGKYFYDGAKFDGWIMSKADAFLGNVARMILDAMGLPMSKLAQLDVRSYSPNDDSFQKITLGKDTWWARVNA